ncbi:Protein of unknown function [Chryseolinea serpens]|jgi:hypothetical protein|uniref:DUF2589 domain-containing protein n=1 Tax=Chryseolinea serpens TaxID=947013 RepID=A0A1M5P2I8_9BACT|nr:DUF2589 domain-containing protein [Chryseolinea serpens]SHG96002.1 Protein of unknown function [Chryseolinea serpens]
MAKKDAVAESALNVSPAEFEKIPLEFVIATPLLTTIKAHQVAAQTTLEFVKGLLNKDGVMPTVEFTMQVKETRDGKEVLVDRKITVPLITLVKVPSLNFDSLSVSFNYNISQVVTDKNAAAQSAKLQIGTTGILSKFVNASLSGSIDHSRSTENTANRGGSLDIKIHVSESAMPPGLLKVINALVDNINTPEQEAAPAPVEGPNP